MYHDDSNFEIINGKKVLRDSGRMRVPLRMRDSLRRRTQVVDAYGSTRFHRPGYRFADVTDADIADERRRAYQEYENDLVNAYKNPAGDVGSRNLIGQSARVTGSKPRDEGREQYSFDPIELSEIREALRARGYGAEEIQDFIDCINAEDDDAILRSSVQARIREFEMKRGQGTPRQQTDSSSEYSRSPAGAPAADEQNLSRHRA